MGDASTPAALREHTWRAFLRWVAEHDERWLFTLLYVGLAVVLSLWISLFWLVAVVAAHGALEWWSLRQRGFNGPLLGPITWHLKLDIALILFALWLGVYMETLFGIAGLGSLARTGAHAGARFIAWQRVLRGILLTVDDAAQVARAVEARVNGGVVESGDAGTTERGWRGEWTRGDRATLAFGTLWLVLIMLAPWLTEHDALGVLTIMGLDLHPWPQH
ncbi:MAG TPA: hypothetical protein PKZ76_12290 [Xanthomonadaceae bacterium]|nr:hypothetical protein [Xanthomonadaceae bacterium]